MLIVRTEEPVIRIVVTEDSNGPTIIEAFDSFGSLGKEEVTMAYYVVSDVWMGRQMHMAVSAEQAARNQSELMRQIHGEEAKPSQFLAWPEDDWPDLSNEAAFEWIRQRRGV